MLNFKDIATKTTTTLLTGLILGGGTFMYNSISSKYDKFNSIMESHPNLIAELDELKGIREEMESEYKRFKVLSKDKSVKLEARISDVELHQKDQDKTLKYSKEWVDYWVSLR